MSSLRLPGVVGWKRPVIRQLAPTESELSSQIAGHAVEGLVARIEGLSSRLPATTADDDQALARVNTARRSERRRYSRVSAAFGHSPHPASTRRTRASRSRRA